VTSYFEKEDSGTKASRYSAHVGRIEEMNKCILVMKVFAWKFEKEMGE
jgi:hypothetical protein